MQKVAKESQMVHNACVKDEQLLLVVRDVPVADAATHSLVETKTFFFLFFVSFSF